MAKLRAQAKKVKEVLSANTNIPVHIEGDEGGREGDGRGRRRGLHEWRGDGGRLGMRD